MTLTSDQVKDIEKEEAKGEKRERKKERKERDDEPPQYDVVITWAEECLELHDFFSTRMSGSQVNIVVLPLPSGLYHIRVYRKDSQVRTFGPLVDDVSVVSRDVLPVLVRQTALNAYIACKSHSGNRRLPYEGALLLFAWLLLICVFDSYIVRRMALAEIVAKARTKQTMEEWWAAQFPTVKELEGYTSISASSSSSKEHKSEHRSEHKSEHKSSDRHENKSSDHR